MRVLVSGASGFIGSHLVKVLRTSGLCAQGEVRGMVRYVSGGRWNAWAGYADSVMVDMRDGEGIQRAVADYKPDIIIHLAAQSAVSYSFTHAEEVAEVNYMGTVRIIEAIKSDKCHPYLISASSSEVYGTSRRWPACEEDPIGGTSPYAAAKIAAEEAIRVAGRTGGLQYTIVRPFNTCGRAPLDNRRFVVESAITQAIESDVIKLHDPRPLRDFLFRDDHVSGYLAIVQAIKDGRVADVRGQTFNLCTGDTWSIKEMANLVAEEVGELTGQRKIGVEFSEHPDRPLDIPVLWGSNAKARGVLGWTPKYTIVTALKEACSEWIERLWKEK